VVVRLTQPRGTEQDGQASDLLSFDISNTMIEQVLETARKNGLDARIERRDDLWSFFTFARFCRMDDSSRVRGRTTADEQDNIRPVLIIDQFEELFTRFDQAAKERFIDQFADLVNNRVPEKTRLQAEEQVEAGEKLPDEIVSLAYGTVGPETNVLIAIREDFLPQLEELKDKIPGIFRTTYRLLPLNGDQAREAIELPPTRVGDFGGEAFCFDSYAVDELLAFLKVRIVGGKETSGDSIEPLQLQILCQDLDTRRKLKHGTRISKADLGGVKGMRRVIKGYYLRVIKRLPRARWGWNGRRFRISMDNWLVMNFPRVAARYLCEVVLITSRGQRNSLAGDDIATRSGVVEHDLEALVEGFLLRREPRLDASFYELSHDSLLRLLLVLGQLRQWTTMFRRGLVVTLALILVIGYPAIYWLPKLARADVAPTVRIAAIRSLAKLGLPLPLYSVRLDGLSLRGLSAESADFSSSYLFGVDFDGATIVRPIFTDATLDIHDETQRARTSFKGATLRNGTFDRARIAARFSDANLYGASFIGSQFDIDHVDFINAFLQDARFDKSIFDRPAVFRGASWWLAKGWVPAQFANLKGHVGGRVPELAGVQEGKGLARALYSRGSGRADPGL
jgi:hypothetical protein